MSVSRVCIHADCGGDPRDVDVALPSGAPVGALLPTIVALVDDRARPGDSALRWRLDRPSGDTVEESLSLADNGIRDGEILVLSSECAPAFGPLRRTACHVVATAQPTGPDVAELLPGTGCILAGVLAALLLASTAGSPSAMVNAAVAAVAAAIATAVTFATGHGTASSLTVVSLVGATGFLAVPSGPAAPNVFLAATAAFTSALLLQRFSGRVLPSLTAVAVLSLLTAVVTAVSLPVAMTGSALSTASVALLALAPRLSVLAAGLGSELASGDVGALAVTGHAVLTGLVAGAAAGAATGVAVVALTPDVATQGAIAFAAVIGAVLLLRARSHADPSRHIALLAGGFVSVVAGLCLAVSAYRVVTDAAAGILVVAALIVARRPRCGAPVARLLDLVEYAALAAVVPTACWMAGGFQP